jgi:hypothetical protein
MNAANTAWSTRARLISDYDLHLVTFEHRWARRYRWAFEHGRLRGSAAGLDVIELDPVARALPSPAPSAGDPKFVPKESRPLREPREGVGP